MNTRQTNILNMSHAVSRALVNIVADHPLPVLMAKVETFNAKVAEIEAQAALQGLPTSGKRVDRDRVFAAAIQATLVVADLVGGYAQTQGLSDLEAKVRLTSSMFTSARLGHRVPLMQQVHDAALAVLPQLAGIGVTAETLAALKTRIDAANAVKTASRAAVVERRVATQTLVILFRELTALLKNELDPQMKALRETDPKASAAYSAARDVINQPGASEKPEAAATTATAATAAVAASASAEKPAA